MDIYNLETQDIELINKILELNRLILNCYNNLNNYDVNSKEYLLVLNQICSLKYQVNKLIENITGSLIMQSMMEYLYPKDKINNFKEDLQILIQEDQEEMAKRRLLIALLNKKMHNDMQKLDSMAITLEQDIKFYDLEEMCKGINNPCYRLGTLLKVSDSLKQDFIRILSLVLEESNKHYYVAYLYEELENNLLRQEFNQDHRIYFNSELEADLACFTSSEYITSKSMYGYHIIDKLLCENNNGLNPTLEAILCTALLFCIPEEIKKLKNKYGVILDNIMTKRKEYLNNKLSR